jgi:hypothetical protein
LLRACITEFSPALYGFKDLRSVSPATTRWAEFPAMQLTYQYVDVTKPERLVKNQTFVYSSSDNIGPLSAPPPTHPQLVNDIS